MSSRRNQTLAMILCAAGALACSACGDVPPAMPAAAQTPVAQQQSTERDAPPKKKAPRPKRQPTPDRPLIDPDAADQPQPARDLTARPRPIDEEQLQENGLRQLDGRFITLFTDLPADEVIDALPEVFDQAVSQWRAYFRVPEDNFRWRMFAYLMQDKHKFWKCGLTDDDLPDFSSGFTRGREFWMYQQPNAYYTRHLLLHEGTHGFMFSFVSDTAPPWYNEGMAEYFGTHQWQDGKLTTGYYPADRDEVPLWGRIKLIKDAYAARKGLTLLNVMAMNGRAHLINESYGWSWGAGAFLDGHPRYRERFRRLPEFARADNFNQKFQELYPDDWDDLLEEWQVFIGNVDYGYDFERMAIDFRPGEPLPAGGAKVQIAADRGWQSTGIRLEKHKRYLLTAGGRYQIVAEPEIWWCEPGGVSIHYFRGSPLGIVQAAVRPERVDPTALSSLLQFENVGLSNDLLPTYDGTLYLRINDSPARLSDNAGEATVNIRQASE